MESSAEVVCGVGASRASKPNFAEMYESVKCLKKIAILCAHHHVLTHCIINIIIISVLQGMPEYIRCTHG